MRLANGLVMAHLATRLSTLSLAAVLGSVALGTAACGEDDTFDPLGDPTASAGPATSGAGAAPATGGGDAIGSGASGSVGSGGDPSVGGSGPEPPDPGGLADVGSLVILGDSISDGGGQPPYYYQLLHDALEGYYGSPIVYENVAQSGSQTGALLGQVASLPSTMPGPVVVVITSGGNNLKNNAIAALLGNDETLRQQMTAEIDAALDALEAPDRFGPGVDVHVFETNIYDASDGQGNFATGGCALPVNAPNGSTEIFAAWNQAIADAVDAHQQVLVDMHGHFQGHGFNGMDSWYASDCTHPNSAGHAAIESLVYGMITGPVD